MPWKATKWILRVAAFLLAVTAVPVVLLTLIAFALLGPTEQEIDRVTSPDGKYDAVVVETNGGATTDFGYLVYIVDSGDRVSGSKVAAFYGAWQTQNLRGIRLKWQQSSACLAVEFQKARTARLEKSFLPFWRKDVKVTLQPTSRPTAPNNPLHATCEDARA